MCSPTLMISAAMNGMKMMQSLKQQKNAKQQALTQNARAKQNRILKATAEDFKIRQKRAETMSKAYAMNIKGREARSTAFTGAEGVGGGIINKLVNNYFRQEGMYKSKVLSNLQAEAFQSQRAKESYRLGQEYQSKDIPDVQYLPTFASASLNYASSYLDWKAGETAKKQAKDQSDYYRSRY